MSLDEIFDYLKQHEVFYAGAGVAGVIIKHNRAFHFYTSEAPRLIEDLHSHKRSYTSTVLKGRIRNNIYEIQGLDPINGKLLVNIQCELLCGKGGCAQHEVVQRNLHVVKVAERITECGESYSLSYKDFHMFELLTDGPVITCMGYSPIQQPNTQILVDESYLSNKCCPLNPSEDELWEMVRSCLEPEKSGMEIVLRDNPMGINPMGFSA